LAENIAIIQTKATNKIISALAGHSGGSVLWTTHAEDAKTKSNSTQARGKTTQHDTAREINFSEAESMCVCVCSWK